MLWISRLTGIGRRDVTITPGDHAACPSASLQAAAEAAVPGSTATQYIAPLAPDRVAAFAVAAGEEHHRRHPRTPIPARSSNTFPWRAGWYDFATDIHGTLLIGDTGDWLIEAAASLGLLLTVTGIYLHWPRNGAGWARR